MPLLGFPFPFVPHTQLRLLSERGVSADPHGE